MSAVPAGSDSSALATGTLPPIESAVTRKLAEASGTPPRGSLPLLMTQSLTSKLALD
jgi:hypothetical protein